MRKLAGIQIILTTTHFFYYFRLQIVDTREHNFHQFSPTPVFSTRQDQVIGTNKKYLKQIVVHHEDWFKM